jgi:hypothetical protein
LRITLLGELGDGQWGMTIALTAASYTQLGFFQDGDDRIGVISGLKTISHGILFSLSIHCDDEP